MRWREMYFEVLVGCCSRRIRDPIRAAGLYPGWGAASCGGEGGGGAEEEEEEREDGIIITI